MEHSINTNACTSASNLCYGYVQGFREDKHELHDGNTDNIVPKLFVSDFQRIGNRDGDGGREWVSHKL